MSARRRGFSLIEVLLAAVLVCVVVVGYLTLTASEVRWSRGVDDRVKALTLARNMLAVVQVGYRSRLLTGAPQGDGSYLVANAHEAIPEGSLALGTALLQWVQNKTKLGGFAIDLRWTPGPRGSGGTPVDSVARAECRVSFKLSSGETRCAVVTRVLSR